MYGFNYKQLLLLLVCCESYHRLPDTPKPINIDCEGADMHVKQLGCQIDTKCADYANAGYDVGVACIKNAKSCEEVKKCY